MGTRVYPSSILKRKKERNKWNDKFQFKFQRKIILNGMIIRTIFEYCEYYLYIIYFLLASSHIISI